MKHITIREALFIFGNFSVESNGLQKYTINAKCPPLYAKGILFINYRLIVRYLLQAVTILLACSRL